MSAPREIRTARPARPLQAHADELSTEVLGVHLAAEREGRAAGPRCCTWNWAPRLSREPGGRSPRAA